MMRREALMLSAEPGGPLGTAMTSTESRKDPVVFCREMSVPAGAVKIPKPCTECWRERVRRFFEMRRRKVIPEEGLRLLLVRHRCTESWRLQDVSVANLPRVYK